MRINVLKNAKAQFAIQLDNADKVFTCRDQKFEIIPFDVFSDNKEEIIDVTDLFADKKNNDLILKKLKDLELLNDEVVWANSLSFVTHVITGKPEALPTMPLKVDEVKFLHDPKIIDKEKTELSSFINEIDNKLLKPIKGFDSLKAEYGKTPKIGDHLVIFSYMVALERSPYYIVLEERHCIVLEDGWDCKVLCSSGALDNSYEKKEDYNGTELDSLSKITTLKEFLNFNSHEIDNITKMTNRWDSHGNPLTYIDIPSDHFLKPYLFENSGINVSKLTQRIQQLSLNKENNIETTSFRKTIARIQTGTDRAAPKGFSIRLTARKWQKIKLQFHRINEIINLNRKTGGYSLQEIANHINVSRQTINNWANEKNTKREIPFEKIIKIAELFNIVPHYLAFPLIDYPSKLPTRNKSELKVFSGKFNFHRTTEYHDIKEHKNLLECDKKLFEQLKPLYESELIPELQYVDNYFKNKTKRLIAKKIEKEENKKDSFFFDTDFSDGKTKSYYLEDKEENKDLIFYHNQDEHLSPEIKKDDYLLVDKSFDNRKLKDNIQDIISSSPENTSNSKMALGLFLIQLDNLVVNAKIYFDILSKEVIINFLSDDSEIKAPVISVNPVELGEYEIVNSRRDNFSIVEIMGKIRQVVRTV